jgi:hypothetical protein
LKKLKSAEFKNEVYVGNKLIYDGNDTKMGFTDRDLPNVKKLLKNQWSLLPSSKSINDSLMPGAEDQYRSQTMKKIVEEKLIMLNKSLKAPQDAQPHLDNGKISISNSVNGTQYDVAGLLKDYQKQEEQSQIHLNPVYIQPLKADNPIVKNEAEKLRELVQRTIYYKVQKQVYTLKGSDLIKNATVSKDLKVALDTSDIKNKLDQINQTQSTLGKSFQFRTHSGSVISVPGQSYGWAIDVSAEANRIQEAFEKGENSISADNIYGTGWTTYGTGYDRTSNGGIGNTYAEVSIKEQRIWLYKNGQLVVTTNVVTGRHNTHEDTPMGVWYIMYKQSPSTLTGSEVGNPNYSVKVQYWTPFTLSGCGFHDASWRKNWASNAYLTAGSGGCVNTPPSIMKTVYDNLSQNEPVVVY